MNWSNRNVVATVLAVSLACSPSLAAAQVKPPEAIPDLPDEPLPEWRPPPPRHDIVHLDVAPSVKKAQDLRQAGLWCMSIGGIMMFAAGILWARALNLNDAAGHFHNEITFDGINYNTVGTNVFNPHLE